MCVALRVDLLLSILFEWVSFRQFDLVASTKDIFVAVAFVPLHCCL